MRSKALGGLLAAALSLSPAVAIGVQTAQYGIDATFIDLREGLCHELHDFIAVAVLRLQQRQHAQLQNTFFVLAVQGITSLHFSYY